MNATELEIAIKNNDLDKLKILFENDNITCYYNPELYYINSEETFLYIKEQIKLDEDTLCQILCQNYNEDNIGFFRILIYKYDIDPSFSKNILLQMASKDGKLGFVKLLIKHPKINPAYPENESFIGAIIKEQEVCALHLSRIKEIYEGEEIERAIRFTYVKKMFSVVNSLWKHKKNRDKLKIRNKKLYDKLVTINNIRDF